MYFIFSPRVGQNLGYNTEHSSMIRHAIQPRNLVDSKCQNFSCTWVVDGCFISVLGRPSIYFYLNIILALDCLLFSVSGHSMSYVVTCTFWLDLLG